jgi:hypothetical protein
LVLKISRPHCSAGITNGYLEMSSTSYVYEIREVSWQCWDVLENGKVLASLASKRAAENFKNDWVNNGRRDHFYNMFGE